jgi:hypothetical protein
VLRFFVDPKGTSAAQPVYGTGCSAFIAFTMPVADRAMLVTVTGPR